MGFSLRYTIPIILIIFIVVSAIWSLRTNGRIAVNRVEKDMSSKLTNILTLLQDNVEHKFRINNLERMQKEISSFYSSRI